MAPTSAIGRLAAPFLHTPTEEGSALKARLMDELDPELNEIRPENA